MHDEELFSHLNNSYILYMYLDHLRFTVLFYLICVVVAPFGAISLLDGFLIY